MADARINHFLVVYDIPNAVARVDAYELDYERALDAYSKTEAEYRDNPDVEVVLLGSDSIETLERTHSSYFELAGKHVDQVVARELAALGLR